MSVPVAGRGMKFITDETTLTVDMAAVSSKALIMENYRIYCEESERAEIMSILRKYNDVVIDNVSSTSFGITIEREDPESFYNNLMDEIDREVYMYRRDRDRIETYHGDPLANKDK